MGQSLSSKKEPDNTVRWPPLEAATTEQFKERFRDEFGFSCLTSAQAEWLQTATAQFATGDAGDWTETDIAEFLAISFPLAREDIQRARPLLYRCMLHLGSFPYLNQPAPALTDDIMRVALVFLLQRHQRHGGPVGVALRISGSEKMAQREMRSLLFQSMRTTQPAARPEGAPRTEADDDYILQAHQYIDQSNYRHHKRLTCRVDWGPPIIPPDELPSPNSADHSGTIPKDQLLSFVRICRTIGSMNEAKEKQIQRLAADSSTTIEWENFAAAIGSMWWKNEIYILDEISLLFTPFVIPPAGVSIDSITSASKEEAIQLLSKGGPPTQSAMRVE